jgi:predicted KAP-like P-loop ATPase
MGRERFGLVNEFVSRQCRKFTKHVSRPIDLSNPWSDDVLKRSELAEQLTAALSTVTQPFVLGLHGELGNGKTFFIKRWQQELLNARDLAVYFNAWKTDYAAEPLIAFAAAIKKQLEKHDLGAGKETAKALASSAGRIVLKALLPRAISVATGGLVQASDVSALTAIGDQISGAASDITDRAVEEAVKHYEQARGEMEHFRSILAGCAQALNERETGRVRKLIVFVDELDRCRPDYAVHVLECIKHFFSVDHVIFVIAIDRDALTESIRAVYGDRIDVDGYLRKFFDYHVELSAPDYMQFAQLLALSFRLEEAIPRRLDDWLEILSTWSRLLNLSLRMQEQVLSQANFIVRSFNENNWLMHDLTIIS